jgi:hypothetical protein
VSDAITDAALRANLARFAALAARALDDPAAWLGDNSTDPRSVPVELARRVRRFASGRCHPGSPRWQRLPVEQRVRWWVRRIGATAVPIAATPRLFGVLADRVPLQGALGSAAAGLAVCAAAREHGIDEPAAWVPLLGRVLFDRDLARPDDADVVVRPEDQDRVRRHGVVRRGGAGLWRLGRVLWASQRLFDERPRGAWVWRALGKVPVVGLAAGLLDERGAVARAARQTTALVRSRPAAPRGDAQGRAEPTGEGAGS